MRPKGSGFVDRRAGKRLDGRLIYYATVIAIVGVTAGEAIGLALPAPTTLLQTSGVYSGSNQAPAGFAQSPTLSTSSVPANVTTCTAGPLTESTNGGTLNVVLSDVTGGTACTANDFAELFTVAFSATISAGSPQTDRFTVTTSYGTGPTTGFNSVSVTTGSPGSPWTQTINLYVDYGASLPTGGIDSLTLVIE